jgi:hypothetical protein
MIQLFQKPMADQRIIQTDRTGQQLLFGYKATGSIPRFNAI